MQNIESCMDLLNRNLNSLHFKRITRVGKVTKPPEKKSDLKGIGSMGNCVCVPFPKIEMLQ